MTDDPTDTPLPPYSGIDNGANAPVAPPPPVPTDPGAPSGDPGIPTPPHGAPFPPPPGSPGDVTGPPPGPSAPENGQESHGGLHLVCNDSDAAQHISNGGQETCSLYPGNIPVTVGPVVEKETGGTMTAAFIVIALAVVAALAGGLFVYLKKKTVTGRAGKHAVPKTEAEAFAEDGFESVEFDEADHTGDGSEPDKPDLAAASSLGSESDVIVEGELADDFESAFPITKTVTEPDVVVEGELADDFVPDIDEGGTSDD